MYLLKYILLCYNNYMENISDNLKKILIFVLIGAIIIVLFVMLFSKKEEPVEQPATIISVVDRDIKLEIGSSTDINYTSNSSVSFSSSDTNVAIVDNRGHVTALSKGNSTILLISSDRKTTVAVNVTVIKKAEPLKVSSVKVESSNDFSKNYVRKGDGLIINIDFNRNLEERPKIMINEEELPYTLNSNRSYIFVEKEVEDEKELKLKVYDGDTQIYTFDLPKIDNEVPKCSLKQEGEYLRITGTDNYGISGYAISQDKNYSYSSTEMIKFSTYGKWYGHVRDNAGNEGSCSITLVKPIINIDPANITIVGDSRMWLLCRRDWYKAENGSCVAKSAMGYNWLVSDAIGMVNALSSSKKKYIVNNLGVNDLYHVDKYISKYTELANGSWKNYMIFLLSVNPTKGKYDDRNSKINEFNVKLKDLANRYTNIHYCDSNSYLKSHGFGSSDGLHYDNDTDKVIYDQIKKCIYNYYN